MLFYTKLTEVSVVDSYHPIARKMIASDLKRKADAESEAIAEQANAEAEHESPSKLPPPLDQTVLEDDDREMSDGTPPPPLTPIKSTTAQDVTPQQISSPERFYTPSDPVTPTPTKTTHRSAENTPEQTNPAALAARADGLAAETYQEPPPSTTEPEMVAANGPPPAAAASTPAKAAAVQAPAPSSTGKKGHAANEGTKLPTVEVRGESAEPTASTHSEQEAPTHSDPPSSFSPALAAAAKRNRMLAPEAPKLSASECAAVAAAVTGAPKAVSQFTATPSSNSAALANAATGAPKALPETGPETTKPFASTNTAASETRKPAPEPAKPPASSAPAAAARTEPAKKTALEPVKKTAAPAAEPAPVRAATTVPSTSTNTLVRGGHWDWNVIATIFGAAVLGAGLAATIFNNNRFRRWW
jgi:hypothetical protein